MQDMRKLSDSLAGRKHRASRYVLIISTIHESRSKCSSAAGWFGRIYEEGEKQRRVTGDPRRMQTTRLRVNNLRRRRRRRRRRVIKPAPPDPLAGLPFGLRSYPWTRPPSVRVRLYMCCRNSFDRSCGRTEEGRTETAGCRENSIEKPTPDSALNNTLHVRQIDTEDF